MNILKPLNVNSMTLKKIENFDEKDYFLWLSFVCVNFHEQVIIKTIFLLLLLQLLLEKKIS
jgi:hypothetical protein